MKRITQEAKSATRTKRIKTKIALLFLPAVLLLTGECPAYSLIIDEFRDIDPNHDVLKLSAEVVPRTKVSKFASEATHFAFWKTDLCVSELPFFIARPFHSNILETFADPVIHGLEPVPAFSPLVQYPGYHTLLALSEPCTTIYKLPLGFAYSRAQQIDRHLSFLSIANFEAHSRNSSASFLPNQEEGIVIPWHPGRGWMNLATIALLKNKPYLAIHFLQQVNQTTPKYYSGEKDFLLALAYAQTGQVYESDLMFKRYSRRIDTVNHASGFTTFPPANAYLPTLAYYCNTVRKQIADSLLALPKSTKSKVLQFVVSTEGNISDIRTINAEGLGESNKDCEDALQNLQLVPIPELLAPRTQIILRVDMNTGVVLVPNYICFPQSNSFFVRSKNQFVEPQKEFDEQRQLGDI